MAQTNTKIFSDNYKVLSETVEKLRHAELSDVDHLLEHVEKASQAYKNCKSRLEAVKQLIEGHKKEQE